MKYTSAEANRLLKKLADDRKILLSEEENSSTFKASVGENPDDVRPDYNYLQTQATINQIDEKVRKIKHAINLSNINTVLPNAGITVDVALILMPQLKGMKNKLSIMQSRLKKQRADDRYSSSPIIDYEYANYDINIVKQDYNKVSKQLSDLQLELDSVNNSVLIDIDI